MVLCILKRPATVVAVITEASLLSAHDLRTRPLPRTPAGQRSQFPQSESIRQMGQQEIRRWRRTFANRKTRMMLTVYKQHRTAMASKDPAQQTARKTGSRNHHVILHVNTPTATASINKQELIARQQRATQCRPALQSPLTLVSHTRKYSFDLLQKRHRLSPLCR